MILQLVVLTLALQAKAHYPINENLEQQAQAIYNELFINNSTFPANISE